MADLVCMSLCSLLVISMYNLLHTEYNRTHTCSYHLDNTPPMDIILALVVLGHLKKRGQCAPTTKKKEEKNQKNEKKIFMMVQSES